MGSAGGLPPGGLLPAGDPRAAEAEPGGEDLARFHLEFGVIPLVTAGAGVDQQHAVRLLQQPLAGEGAGVAPLFRAKKQALQQGGRDGRTVLGDKRSRPASSVPSRCAGLGGAQKPAVRSVTLGSWPRKRGSSSTSRISASRNPAAAAARRSDQKTRQKERSGFIVPHLPIPRRGQPAGRPGP